MSDYIKREDAVKVMCGECLNYALCYSADADIPVCPLFWKMQSVPAADVVERPRWIPVTEKLPKVDGEVLIYLWGRPYIASIDQECRWETNDFYIDIEDTPKAWMPLPKPPKEGET